jgi:hypothetical protein
MSNVGYKFKIALLLGFIATTTIVGSIGCINYPMKESQVSISKNIEIMPSDRLPPVIFVDLVLEMLGKVDINRAKTDIRKLTGEESICNDTDCYTIYNRLTGSEGLSWAKKFVFQKLVQLGYSVELQDWSRSDYTDQNIVARKIGTVYPEEEIYFVAHLDGVAGSPAADDNASGVVDLLELARVLSGYSFSRTIVLLISTGEEQGTLGVQSYLSQLSASELGSIQYVVNIDMVGYDANQDGVMELWHGDHSPSLDLVHWMSDILQTYQLDISPQLVVGCG